LLKNINSGYETNDNPCATGFYLYDLNKGYRPGSIIKVISHPLYKNRIRVKDVQITREKIEKDIIKPGFIAIGDSTPISSCTFDRTNNFEFNLSGNVNDGYFNKQDFSSRVESSLKNIESVNLVVNKGIRYGLKDGGGSSLHDIINFLSEYELEKLSNLLREDENLIYVSEVIEYNDAKVLFNWKDSIEGTIQMEILSSLNLDGTYGWTDKKELSIRYSENSIVGFLGKPLGENEAKLISKVIETRKEKGELIKLYADSDKDGYGDKDENKSIIIGEKEEPYKITNGNKIFYVLNNLDPDDGDSNRQPNETKWYEDRDGDGYGNPNNIIFGIKCPAGFVKDNRDCYDGNKNAFPGQTNYFDNHRGDGSFDYDCNGSDNKKFTVVGGCVNSCKRLRSGWESGVPACGSAALFVVGCDNGHFPDYGCSVARNSKVQLCR